MGPNSKHLPRLKIGNISNGFNNSMKLQWKENSECQIANNYEVAENLNPKNKVGTMECVVSNNDSQLCSRAAESSPISIEIENVADVIKPCLVAIFENQVKVNPKMEMQGSECKNYDALYTIFASIEVNENEGASLAESLIGDVIVKIVREIAHNDRKLMGQLEKCVNEVKTSLAKLRINGGTGSSLEELEDYFEALSELISKTTRGGVALEYSNSVIGKEDVSVFYNFNKLLEVMEAIAEKQKTRDSCATVRVATGVEQKEKAKDGVFSAAVGEESMKLYYLLLKRLKQFPQLLFDSKSEYTETSSETGEGRKLRLSKVTRQIRAKMRRRTEKERQDLASSEDENH